MTQEEITAEVFKVIRANEYVSVKRLWILIKEHLPDTPEVNLRKALQWLYEHTE